MNFFLSAGVLSASPLSSLDNLDKAIKLESKSNSWNISSLYEPMFPFGLSCIPFLINDAFDKPLPVLAAADVIKIL